MDVVTTARELTGGPAHGLDLEDLAAEFVETDLGRYDAVNNWARVQQDRQARVRTTAWLRRNNLPDTLAPQLEDALAELLRRPGRWRGPRQISKAWQRKLTQPEA